MCFKMWVLVANFTKKLGECVIYTQKLLRVKGKGHILDFRGLLQVGADLSTKRPGKTTQLHRGNLNILYILSWSSLLLLPTVLRERRSLLGRLSKPSRAVDAEVSLGMPAGALWRQLINYCWNMQREFKQRCVQWGFSGTCDQHDSR